MLREACCPNSGVFPFCHSNAEKRATYEAGSIETLVRISDENGGYTIIPELHVPLLNDNRQNRIRHLRNPQPACERLLNILADALKMVIPQNMIYERLKKFPINL